MSDMSGSGKRRARVAQGTQDDHDDDDAPLGSRRIAQKQTGEPMKQPGQVSASLRGRV
jgi:hypothetical protein